MVSFSTYLSKNKFDGRLLHVKGEKNLVFLLLLLFLLGLLAALPKLMSAPFVILMGIAFSIFILIYALIDVATSVSELKYDIATGKIFIRRGAFFRNFRYVGHEKKFLKINHRKDIDTDMAEDTYTIYIEFSNNHFRAPYILDYASYSLDELPEKLNEWKKRLEL